MRLTSVLGCCAAQLVTWSLAQTGSQLAESALHDRASGPFLVSRPGGEPAPRRPYGQLFAIDGRRHLITCGATGGRLYQVNSRGSARSGDGTNGLTY